MQGMLKNLVQTMLPRYKENTRGWTREDVTEEDLAIIGRVKSFTMTSEERILALIDSVRHICQAELSGSIVECGVWRGGSSMAAALTLLQQNCNDRDLYLYDTFEGMCEPTERDVSFDGVSADRQLSETQWGEGVWCVSSLGEVQQAMASTLYPQDRVHLIKGRVEETIPNTIPGQIAILRLDTDWYESTKHELENLYPRLVPGGILIIDDYGHWTGARKAVDEYFAENNVKPFFNRIDYTGRLYVKPMKAG